MDTMSVTTIPRKITKGTELVVIPKKEYEDLVELKRLYEFKPTSAQKKALTEARKNREKGKVLTFSKLKNKLGFTN